MSNVTPGSQRPIERTNRTEITIVATADDDLRFADAVAPPAHADAVLDALRARLPVDRYDGGATVATLTDWKLHTLEINPYE